MAKSHLGALNSTESTLCCLVEGLTTSLKCTCKLFAAGTSSMSICQINGEILLDIPYVCVRTRKPAYSVMLTVSDTRPLISFLFIFHCCVMNNAGRFYTFIRTHFKPSLNSSQHCLSLSQCIFF